MGDVLGAIMRWLHYSSVATLIGGILYGRLVMLPASADALTPAVTAATQNDLMICFIRLF